MISNPLQGTGSTYVMNAVTNDTKVYVQMGSNAVCAQPKTVTSATTTVNCKVTAIPTMDGRLTAAFTRTATTYLELSATE